MARRMISLFLAVLVATLVQNPHVAQAKTDPKKLVEEYVAEATNDSRRLDILALLELSGSASLATPLKKSLGAEATRNRAIDLAMLMQVRGLFDAMKPAYDAGEISRVVSYGMLLQEKGAGEWIFERWKTLDKDSDEWLALTNELLNLPIEQTVLKKWVDLAKNKDFDRRKSAAHIVSRQIGESITDADEVVRLWPEWEKTLKAEGLPQACAGLNVLFRSPWEAKNRKPWGFNYRIDEGGFMDCRDCPPASASQGSFQITARVFIPVDSSIAVNLLTKAPGAAPGVGYSCPLTFADKKWHLEAGENYSKDGVYGPGKWATIGFEVARPPKDPARHGCDVSYLIEGKRIAEKYGQTGDYYKVELRVDRGYAILGAVEYTRK